MWPDHVAPDFAPIIERWGDPIPLIWERESLGEWVAWKPQQFLTQFDDEEETLWRIERGFGYRPIVAASEEKQALSQEILRHSISPFGAEYAHLGVEWRAFPNGIKTVHQWQFSVEIHDRRVEFEDRYIFPCLLYAHSVSGRDLSDPVRRVAGPIGGPNRFEWLRRNDDPECSRWPCHVKISPKGVHVSDADESVLAPRPPTQEDIDRERASLGVLERSRDCVTFTKDLCQSQELCKRMRSDTFAFAFLGVIEKRRIRYIDGTVLEILGEDSPGYVVTSVRPFHEHFGAFPPLSGTSCTPELLNEIAALLKDCGYTIE